MPATVRLATALLALAVLAVAPGTAGAAKHRGSAKRCASHRVRLVPGGPCIAPPTRGALTAAAAGRIEAPAAKAAAKRFRRVAGPKATRRAAQLVRALATMPATTRARARAAATETQGGEWRETTVDGVPARVRETTVGSDGARPSEAVTVEAQIEQQVDGATITVSKTQKVAEEHAECPDADGRATVHIATSSVERQVVKRGGTSAFIETRTQGTADAVVQLSDTAEIASVEYDGTWDFGVRGTGQPSRRYVGTWHGSVPPPDAPQVSVDEAFAKDPSLLAAGTYRGPRGTVMTVEEVTFAALQRAVQQQELEDHLHKVLVTLQTAWRDTGTCVDLVADPATATLAAGESTTFSFTAHAKDGAPVGGAGTIIGNGHTDPDGAVRLTAGAVLPVRFTMPEGTKDEEFVVEVRSRRGMGSAIVAVRRAKPAVWNVTYTGNGTYERHITEAGGDTDDLADVISWSATYAGVRFDGGSFSPLGTASMSGALHEERTVGIGKATCHGAPYNPPTAVVSAPVPGPGGAMTLHLVPFTAIVASPPSVSCEYVVMGGDPNGAISGANDAAPFSQDVVVTPDLLSRDEFTIAVQRHGDFTKGCADIAPGDQCTETGDLQGTVRFVRAT